MKENEVLKKGIMHCVPINEYLIKETLKLGYYISFAGNITFKENQLLMDKFILYLKWLGLLNQKMEK